MGKFTTEDIARYLASVINYDSDNRENEEYGPEKEWEWPLMGTELDPSADNEVVLTLLPLKGGKGNPPMKGGKYRISVEEIEE